MAIANVQLDTTFDEWRVRTNQLIVQGDQLILATGDLYGRTNSIFTNGNTSYDIANAGFLQANTARLHANLAFATANAALANTNGIVTAGALNVSGNLSVNTALTVTAYDGTAEGGQIILNGAGDLDDWSIESYENNLSFSTTSSNTNSLVVTNRSTGTVNMVLKGHATMASMNVVPTVQSVFGQANTARTHANAAFGQANSAIAAASALIPSGTIMLFVQTTAPTGWTKSTAHDNKALRIVSGAAGSGGTTGFTTAFANRTVSGSSGATGVSGTTGGTGVAAYTDWRQISGSVQYHTLDYNQMPSHRHRTINARGSAGDLASGNAGFGNAPEKANMPTVSNFAVINQGYTTYEGGSGSHNHGFVGDWHQHYFDAGTHTHTFNAGTHTHTFSTTLDLTVAYVDAIIATKD